MVEKAIILVYILFFISMVCALSVTVRLYLSGKNYLIAVLAAGMALLELVVLTSVIWIYDFEVVPREYCIFQGLALHYSAYLQITAALCFSIQLYQLLVLRKQGIARLLQRVYICSIIGIPIIMTIILAVVAIQTKAIQPFILNCDIKNPVWVRLMGYPGLSLILTFIGVYLSIRAAFEVITHLDRFRTTLSSSSDGLVLSNASNTDANDRTLESQVKQSQQGQQSQQDQQGQQSQQDQQGQQGQQSQRSQRSQPNPNLKRTYNMTKAAAIRMVSFSLGFALINIIASLQTLMLVISGKEEKSKGLRGNDFVGALMGILIFLVFGLPRNMKHLMRN